MRIKDTIIINKINDEYVLIDSDTSKNRFNGLIKLNEESKNIIELLHNDISFDELINKMLDIYEVDKDILENDVKSLIDKLNKTGIIV